MAKKIEEQVDAMVREIEGIKESARKIRHIESTLVSLTKSVEKLSIQLDQQ